MVYECEKCNAPLPPGVRACPKCGEAFDDAVPADAEVPQRGFRPSNTPPSSPQYQAPAPSVPSTSVPAQVYVPPVYAAPVANTPALARGWVMVLTFFFCFPLFLIGVWQRPDWSRGAKALATAAFVIMLCILAAVNNTASHDLTSSSSTALPSVSPSQSEPSPSAPVAAPAQTSESTPAPDAGDTAAKPDLEVVDHKSVSDEYARYIVGTVRNNTDHSYSYAQVEINLYDKSGSQVGSTVANINNLAPHGLWKFKAAVLEDNAVRSEIKDVTGF